MSDENDSWLEGIGVDVQGIVGNVPAFEPPAVTDSVGGGLGEAASGLWDAATSAKRAIGDFAEAGFDGAAGAGAKVVSGGAGAAAGIASDLGADGTAQDLHNVETNAGEDANRYFGDANREYAAGRREIDENWLPPGPEPAIEGRGGDDPPPTERPNPPDGDGPPTDRPPPPTERPDRPVEGGPPTERRPNLPKGGASAGEVDENSWLPSFDLPPGVFLNEANGGPPPGRDDPTFGQNKPVDPDDKSFGIKGTFDEFLGKLGLSGVFSDVPGAKGDPAEYNPDSPTKSGPTRYGHLRPKDGPLESDPPPAPPAPVNTDPPPPPPQRTWGVPQPGDPDFIGPPAPPPPPPKTWGID